MFFWYGISHVFLREITESSTWFFRMPYEGLEAGPKDSKAGVGPLHRIGLLEGFLNHLNS